MLTRADTDGRLGLLKQSLGGILRQSHVADLRVMVWANGAGDEVRDYLRTKPVRLFDCAHNAGQHIAMNEMLDEAARIQATYFLRVDDDAVFQTPNWLKKLLTAHDSLEKGGIYSVMSPVINGLNHPPPTIGFTNYGHRRYEQVNILGGICRLHPMHLLRHFRFEERLAMGGGEATQIAALCHSLGVPLLRYPKVQVSHGGSTNAQEAADPVWKHRHDMAQYLPVGL